MLPTTLASLSILDPLLAHWDPLDWGHQEQEEGTQQGIYINIIIYKYVL